MLCLPLHFQDLPIKGVKYFANTSSQTASGLYDFVEIIIEEFYLEFGSFWLLPEFTVSDINSIAVFQSHFLFSGGSVAEWLERWTCNPETPSSSPTLTTSWICSW